MKNVQIIDGAENCTFSVFEFTDQQFSIIFSTKGQDLAFAEELETRLPAAQLAIAFEGVWNRPADKQQIQGLHGTIFYGFSEKRHVFPATRRECDWDDQAVNEAQRQLNFIRRQQSSE